MQFGNRKLLYVGADTIENGAILKTEPYTDKRVRIIQVYEGLLKPERNVCTLETKIWNLK